MVDTAARRPASAKLAALHRAAAPPSVPAQTLRQVSILFLDVVGSTALAAAPRPRGDQRRDGRRLVAWDGHRAGTRAARCCKYAGDNILAVFGADEAREDDAERAVRCGLALLELGKTSAPKCEAAHGHDAFNVRVGVHTGGVLLGGGVDAEGSIRGNAVNIAARMEQTAPAGALRIGHDAYAQVRGMFEVELRSRWPSRAWTSPSRAIWCCAPRRGAFASAAAASKASRHG